MTALKFDRAEAAAFIKEVYGDKAEGWWSISWLVLGAPKPRMVSIAFDDVEDVLDYVEEYEPNAEGMYLRTTTLKSQPKGSKRGGSADTHQVFGLFSDLDYGTEGHATPSGLPLPPDADSALSIVRRAGLPTPSLVVHSGGGLYAWWLLDEPLTGDLDDIARVSAQWQEQLAAGAQSLGWHYGKGVGDLSRVLRLPGTANRKTDVDRPCRVVERDGPRYTADALADALEASQLLVQYEGPRIVPKVSRSAEEMEELEFRRAVDPGPFDILADEVGVGGVLRAAGWADCDCGGDGDCGRGGVEEAFTAPEGGSTTPHSAHTLTANPYVLVVFSESAGLPTGGGQRLTAGRLFALLHHDGDTSAAARDLRAAMADEAGGSDAARALREHGLPLTPAAEDNDEEDLIGEVPKQAKAATATAKKAAPKSTKADRAVREVGDGTRHDAAKLLAKRHGDVIRYDPTAGASGDWLKWDGSVWAKGHGLIQELVLGIAEDLRSTSIEMFIAAGPNKVAKAEATNVRNFSKAMRGNDFNGGAIKFASSNPALIVDGNKFDMIPSLLTVGDRLIVMRRAGLEVREPDPKYLQRIYVDVGYDAEAKSEQWERLIARVFQTKKEQRAFQAAIGYSLYGGNPDKLFFNGIGDPDTFKSFIHGTLSQVFGMEVWRPVDASVFREAKDGAPNPQMVKAVTARVIYHSETAPGSSMHGDVVKRLSSGNDVIPVRGMHSGEYVMRVPAFTPWVMTNYPINITGADAAIKRRIYTIDYGESVDQDWRDQWFANGGGAGIQKKDYPGIVAWALAGWGLYLEGALDRANTPEAWAARGAEIWRSMNTLADFAATMLHCEPELPETEAIEASALWEAWGLWCAAKVEKPGTRDSFARALTKELKPLGLPTAKDGKPVKTAKRDGKPVKVRLGVRLRTKTEREAMEASHE